MTKSTLERPKVVSREEWLLAHKRHLSKEKEFTRLCDRLHAERRELPWVRVDKNYVFDGPDGKKSLSDLFGGRSQLIVYHFMFDPEWEEGCTGCSFVADHIDAALLHLPHHDVTLVAISRAPLAKLQAYKQRMGWRFPWLSSNGNDFNFDYHVSFPKSGRIHRNFEPRESKGDGETKGLSVFYKDEAGDIYHTYSSYERGVDQLIGTHAYLDLTPKGRNESSAMDWVRKHDKYA